MKGKRTDNNQKKIVIFMRKLGATVLDLSGVGKGCPDLLVAFKGLLYLVEVKNPERKWKYTEDQEVFHKVWGSAIHTVETEEDVLKMLGLTI